ncbi:sulfite exporter TauE/SafE family protein, partial [Rhodopseudomonas sp. B29]|uniref:sulfite exporter TauE/SafE family protein n=1 Tax=Rhodopseudomonas sp. B29 TaxID=95607 RepID=UPI0003B52E31
GVIGLGLPTVAIGLLAIVMPPPQAVAIVVVPAIVTNIWQTFAGPYLRDIIRRLWPLIVCTAIGIRAGAGLMTGPYAKDGTVVLGILLVIYGALGLSRIHFKVPQPHEKWLGAVVGLVTGVISAATGIQVIPSMPYMQAIGMERDELVQALGVFFTVATLALAFNLTGAGLLSVATAVPAVIAMAAAFAGMMIGQTVRTRMHPETFRRWFLIAMVALGIYLTATTLAKL